MQPLTPGDTGAPTHTVPQSPDSQKKWLPTGSLREKQLLRDPAPWLPNRAALQPRHTEAKAGATLPTRGQGGELPRARLQP